MIMQCQWKNSIQQRIKISDAQTTNKSTRIAQDFYLKLKNRSKA